MDSNRRKDNLIVNLTLEFASNCILFCDELQLNKSFVLANQLTKSGTSIGANVWEAQNAESKKDFVHKLKIAAKEADETEYWLILCKNTERAAQEKVAYLQEKLVSIQKVLNSIISTTKKQLHDLTNKSTIT
jgi:four helix bundle protein